MAEASIEQIGTHIRSGQDKPWQVQERLEQFRSNIAAYFEQEAEDFSKEMVNAVSLGASDPLARRLPGFCGEQVTIAVGAVFWKLLDKYWVDSRELGYWRQILLFRYWLQIMQDERTRAGVPYKSYARVGGLSYRYVWDLLGGRRTCTPNAFAELKARHCELVPSSIFAGYSFSYAPPI